MTILAPVTRSPVVRRTLLLAPAMTVIGVFFVGGLAQAVAQSLGHQPLVGDSQWSLDAYRSAANDPAVRSSLALTLRIGFLATTIATVLGVAAALLVRRLGAGRAWMTGLFQSTLAVPHLVAALCITLLLSPSGSISRLAATVGVVEDQQDFPAITQDAFGWGIIAEYVWKETPFIAVITLAAMGASLSRLEDVSRTLGAGRWQRLRHVTIPLIAAPVGAAAVLVLAFTMGSYEVPLLLGRPFPAPLSVVTFQEYSDTDLTARPRAMAVAVLLAGMTLVVALLYLLVLRTLGRRRP
ncbi:ABC transporter permease subunit [Cytobacillus oceanisediminis]